MIRKNYRPLFFQRWKTYGFYGFKNGQSDIFIYSFIARSIQQITNDFYDDATPRFRKIAVIFFLVQTTTRSLIISSPKPFKQTETQTAYDRSDYD